MDLLTLSFFHQDKSASTKYKLKIYGIIKQEKDNGGKHINFKNYAKTLLSRVRAINKIQNSKDKYKSQTWILNKNNVLIKGKGSDGMTRSYL